MQLIKIATGLAIAVALVPARVAAAPTGSSGVDGIYRIAWTEKELEAAGTSQRYAHANCPGPCVVTMTLKDGRLRLRWSAPPDCLGTYQVIGGTLSIQQKQHCHGLVTARWSVVNRQLQLRVTKATDPGDRVLFGGRPWKKIG